MRSWVKRKRNNQGFTLIELTIVIAILAILVGILAPQYIKYVEKSRKSTDISNLEQLVKAVQVSNVDTDYYINAGRYFIMMKTDSTIIFTDDSNINDNDLNTQKLVNAVEEYTGYKFEKNGFSYQCNSLKLKSNRWENQYIYAMIYLSEESNIVVEYVPSNIKDLTK